MHGGAREACLSEISCPIKPSWESIKACRSQPEALAGCLERHSFEFCGAFGDYCCCRRSVCRFRRTEAGHAPSHQGVSRVSHSSEGLFQKWECAMSPWLAVAVSAWTSASPFR